MDTDALIDFMIEAGRLKRLPRTGWVESGVTDPESVADHSFRVALITMILADAEGIDALKAVRMALLHDLAEARVGDLTPTQKEKKPDWAHEESIAIQNILSRLPEEQAEHYLADWREYNGAESPEARLVHSTDKLEMLMQASEYQREMGDPGKLMRFRHVTVRGDLEKKLVEDIKRRMG